MDDDAEAYRLRAEELRTIAGSMRDQTAIATLIRLAEQNEARAARLEANASIRIKTNG